MNNKNHKLYINYKSGKVYLTSELREKINLKYEQITFSDFLNYFKLISTKNVVYNKVYYYKFLEIIMLDVNNLKYFILYSDLKATDGYIECYLTDIEDLIFNYDNIYEFFDKSSNGNNNNILSYLNSDNDILTKIDRYINRVRNYGDIIFGVILLDINRFSMINSILGYHTGNELLEKVVFRLKTLIKDESMLAKLSDDEILLLHFENDENRLKDKLKKIAEDIINVCFKQSFGLFYGDIFVSSSQGITYVDKNKLQNLNSFNSHNLLQEANAALHESRKSTFINNYCFYDNNMYYRNKRLIDIGNNLTKALQKNELYFVYQPIMKNNGSDLFGFEILMRWQNEYLGNVPPNEFINVAEETGLIKDIECHLLDESFKFIENIKKSKDDLKVSINVSPIQLMHDDFLNNFLTYIEKHNVSKDDFIIEITESDVMRDYFEIETMIKSIYNENINIFVDDFGKGYSSLSTLNNGLFSGIKTDKSFVINHDNNNKTLKNGKIVKALLNLCYEIDIDVIVEGIESQEHHNEIIKEYVKPKTQGFYYSKPLYYNDVFELLRKY